MFFYETNTHLFHSATERKNTFITILFLPCLFTVFMSRILHEGLKNTGGKQTSTSLKQKGSF